MTQKEEEHYQLDSYRIEKTLGQGTFGKVKLATHMPTQEKVAVKVLQKDKIVDQSDIERVTREICILKILRHPNIVQLYEIIQTPTAIHLVMEYAPNGELFDEIVKNKRLKQPMAATYLQQLLSGVEYIHRNGIVHRDLKPENLLLDENNQIKIVDFGLSNQYKPGDRLKTACGSPCYAAPQMIAGKKYECMGVDLWSCGIILYAMLCGFLPFEDPNTAKLYKKIMAGQYDTPKFLTQRSKHMLKSMLNVNPATRYTLQQIRGTEWIRQPGSIYQARGLIVGKDTISPDERVVGQMANRGIDPHQVRNYVAHNRHNQVTAYYQLLKKKMAKQKAQAPVQSNGVPVIPTLNLNKVWKEVAPEPREERAMSNNKEQVQRKQREAEKFLMGKGEKPKAPTERKPVNSPVIYRPPGSAKNQQGQKISLKQAVHTPRSNDSFNASNIISSLVQANKNKIIGNKVKVGGQRDLDDFGRKQDFKLFPKRRISVTQDLNSSTNKSTTNRSMDEGYDFKSSKASQATPRQPSTDKSYFRQPSGGNKRREQLQKQIKQITQKIDKEITSLKQQNHRVLNNFHQPSPKTVNNHTIHITDSPIHHHPASPISQDKHGINRSVRESHGPKDIKDINSQIAQTQPTSSESARPSSEVSPIRLCPQKHSITSKDSSAQRTSPMSQSRQLHSLPYPRVYNGPINVNCLFAQPPEHLIAKIKAFLSAKHCSYQQPEAFSLNLGGNHWISVETLHGVVGYAVVVFTANHALHEDIIHFLNR